MGEKISRESLVEGIWDQDIDSHPNESTFIIDGYTCKIKRNVSWSYCGYIHLPESHPDFHKRYQDIDKEIVVHGDLTFGNGNGVFGFDCHHILMGDISPLDFSPGVAEFSLLDLSNKNGHYWTYDEVKQQLESLVAQFKARNI